MKKLLCIFLAMFSLQTFAQAATIYNYDYNLATKMARLWVDYEILMEYDAFEDKVSYEDYLLKDGYIYQKSNHSWDEIGFYNDKTLVVNKQGYQLKNPILGKVAVKAEGDVKWISLKKTKDVISFIEDPAHLPEVVQVWALKAALQREIAYREKLMNKQSSVSVGLGVETSL